MKIEKIEPLKCPQCKSTSVSTYRGTITCDGCKYKTKKDGKKEKVKEYPVSKGKNPRYDTGDFLE